MVERIGGMTRQADGLQLLVLFGSRARGDAHAASDWDFGYLATPAADITGLLAALVEIAGTDRIDLVDLARASGVLRFRAARDGQVVHEHTPGRWSEFRLEAAHFWCDMAPVFGAAHADVLARLDRVTAFDASVLAEWAMAVERHLRRVADRLPGSPADFGPSTDASDAVILHLWQATQIVIDLAMAACLARDLGTPGSYADAFRRLQTAGLIDAGLGSRLVRAAGFRNVVAHAYETLDMARVHEAATRGPADLRAFMAALRDVVR
jgi:uncharacterized protein YutE (UPF0331/DUF86 family)/predicted nucleotidyltransferase